MFSKVNPGSGLRSLDNKGNVSFEEPIKHLEYSNVLAVATPPRVQIQNPEERMLC
jgi:hypothetical protein